MSEQSICVILEALQEAADEMAVDVQAFWEVCLRLRPNSPLSEAIEAEAEKRVGGRLQAMRRMEGWVDTTGEA